MWIEQAEFITDECAFQVPNKWHLLQCVMPL